MPIRVEEWRRGEETVFKIVGIVWGGERPVPGLHIHIGDDAPVPVSAFQQKTATTWSLWVHEWRPERRGPFEIWLTVPDPRIRTRRLDRRFYKRQIRI